MIPNLINLNDWSEIKRMDFDLQFWLTSFLVAIAEGSNEVYFQVDNVDISASYKLGGGHHELINPAREDLNEILSFFHSRVIHGKKMIEYVNNSANSYTAIFLKSYLVHVFVWFDQPFTSAAFKLIYDEGTPQAAEQILESFKEGDFSKQ